MSDYDEEGKEQIADDVVDWLVRHTELRESEINVHLHEGWEAYVSIEFEPHATDKHDWNTEHVRNITDVDIDMVDVFGNTVSIAPK